MTYTIFGFNNASGAFFQDHIDTPYWEVWGRSCSLNLRDRFVYCDLSAPLSNPVPTIKGIAVSFAPIWLFAKYLLRLSNEQPHALRDVIGIIAISSSSYITKRFAFNSYDKDLAKSLDQAHRDLLAVSQTHDIHCQILAPTLVYGCNREFRDKNISTIIRLMRISPLIVLPRSVGLRQPIHAQQLALVAKKKGDKMLTAQWGKEEPLVLAVGGDTILSYTDMVRKIQDSLPSGDAGKSCLITTIPNRLFLLIASPLLPINEKLLEAVLRINSNLSGFPKVHELISAEPVEFPVLPLPL